MGGGGGGCSTQGTNHQIMPKGVDGRRFTNTFFSKMKIVNLNIFPNYGGL